jgi:hypothetical protein
MAFTENLATFFDTDSGFAVNATIKTGAGATVRTAKAIFTKPVQELQVFEQSLEASLPFLLLQTTDLAGVDHTHTFTIDAVQYRIVKRNDDGTGLSIVWIK